MDNFWEDCKKDEQKLFVLFIIFIVIIYSNSIYNKIPYRISSFFGKE